MEDDQLQEQSQAVTTEADGTTAQEASPTSTNQSAAQEAETQTEDQSQSGDSQNEPKEPSRRLKKRFEEVFEKGRQAGESRIEAESHLAAAEARFPWESQETTLIQELEQKAQNGELSLTDLDRLATLRAEQKVTEVLTKRQAEAEARARRESRLTSFKSDVEKVQEKYSHYDPESDDYDQELVDELSNMYMKQLEANPDAAPGFAEWIDGIEKIRGRAAERGASQSAEVLANQAAQTAFRPTGGGGRVSAADHLARMKEEAKQSGNWQAYFAEEARLAGK